MVKHFLKLALHVVNDVINHLYSDLTLLIKLTSSFPAYLKNFFLKTVKSAHNFF